MGLNSTSIIKIVDLLCEGPIEGVVDGKKGIFLNETAAIEIDDTVNYSKADIGVEYRTGTKTQKPFKGHKDTNSSVINISEEVGENYNEVLTSSNQVKTRNYGGGEVITQITDEDTDSFEMLFTVPSLFCQGMEGVARGQLFNAIIRIKIFVKSKGSKFKLVKNLNLEGISTSNYQFKVGPIYLSGKPPYIIKVIKHIRGGFTDGNKKKKPRAEEDFEVRFFDFTDINQKTSLANSRGNRLILTSLIERQNIRTAYPYTACVGLKLSTELFSSLPSRSYLVKGLLVKIPHNASVRSDGSLEFTGNFNGSLKTNSAWTTCPVCIFYNILINKRYGCGEFIDSSNLNWIDLYPLAKYANQLVSTPDGKEPRFAINTVIGSQAEAYKVLQNLASVFRGMSYWGSNTVNVTADHGVSNNISSSNAAHTTNADQDPVHLYNNSNVIGGVFSYKGSSLKTRSSSIWVSYNDPDNFYKPNVVVVEDYDLIEKYGYNIKEIIAFGCSSKYQAQRMGQWMLNAEKLDGHIVSFSTGLDGLSVLPSQIFSVSDEMRAGIRLFGRVGAGSTTSHIVVDINYSASLLDIDSFTDFISLTLSDGTVEKIAINAITSDGRINILSAPSSLPLQNSVYVIERSSIKSQKFRCINVKDNNDNTYTITGLEFNDSLYDVVDDTTTSVKAKLDFEDVTAFNNEPTVPEDLNVQATLVQQQSQQIIRLIFSWSRGINAANVKFNVGFKQGGGTYKNEIVDETIFELNNAKAGKSYFFRVKALSITSAKESNYAFSGLFKVPSVKSLKQASVPNPQP